MSGKKKTSPPMNWAERNVVHPMAYGGDQAVNDWAGERGFARPVTKALGLPPWNPVTPKPPEGSFADFASEVPRAIISSGGLAGAASIPRMVVGSAIAGGVRDPGVTSPETEPRRRLVNAAIGAGGGALAAGAGKLVQKGAEKTWQMTRGKSGIQDVATYGEPRTGFVGAKEMHSQPERFGKALDQLPTFRGRIRRGVRPDHPTELAQVQQLQEGQVWQPGKALSADKYGSESLESAWGAIDEADNMVPGARQPTTRAPFLHINTKNARDAKGILGWDEVVTKPDSKFRVDRVIRDKNGNVTDVYLTDLSKPGLARTANDVVKETGRNTAAQATSAGYRQGLESQMKRDASRHGRPYSRKPIPPGMFDEYFPGFSNKKKK